MGKVNRILALGLNPAYQKTILFDTLRLGAVNRSAESHAVASGKGINFARAVSFGPEETGLELPAWGGQPEEILREKSGLALKFCHPSRFLVTAETKEDAIEACRRALRAAGRPVSAQ